MQAAGPGFFPGPAFFWCSPKALSGVMPYTPPIQPCTERAVRMKSKRFAGSGIYRPDVAVLSDRTPILIVEVDVSTGGEAAGRVSTWGRVYGQGRK